MNIQELRSQYNIRIVHLRWAYLSNGNMELATRGQIECRGAFNRGLGYYSGSVTPNGGETIVRLEYEGKIYTGIAQCSTKDNYCRRTGRELAFQRALEKISFNEPDDKVLENICEEHIDNAICNEHVTSEAQDQTNG